MKRYLAAIVALFMVAGCTKNVYQTTPTTEAPATTQAPTATNPPRSTVAYQPPSRRSDHEAFINGTYLLYPTIYVSDQDLIDTGEANCQALNTGSSAEDIMFLIVTAADGDDSIVEFLSAILVSAVTYLCPEHLWMFAEHL